MDEIFRIANQLAANGQVPSTALVKARLRQPVPMATLITAIQRWKQDPDAYRDLGFPGNPVAAEQQPEPATTSQEAQLELMQRQIEQLQQHVTMLAKRVSLLESQS